MPRVALDEQPDSPCEAAALAALIVVKPPHPSVADERADVEHLADRAVLTGEDNGAVSRRVVLGRVLDEDRGPSVDGNGVDGEAMETGPCCRIRDADTDVGMGDGGGEGQEEGDGEDEVAESHGG